MCPLSLKLQSLRPYTSLERGCNTEVKEGIPVYKSLIIPKLTWWQEILQSQTSSFVTQTRATELQNPYKTCRVLLVGLSHLQTWSPLWVWKAQNWIAQNTVLLHPVCNSSIKDLQHPEKPLSKHIYFTWTWVCHSDLTSPDISAQHKHKALVDTAVQCTVTG